MIDIVLLLNRFCNQGIWSWYLFYEERWKGCFDMCTRICIRWVWKCTKYRTKRHINIRGKIYQIKVNCRFHWCYRFWFKPFQIELLNWRPEDLSPRSDGGIFRHVIKKASSRKTPNDGASVTGKLQATKRMMSSEKSLVFQLILLERTRKEHLMIVRWNSILEKFQKMKLFRVFNMLSPILEKEKRQSISK